jgi:biopolymer transport protein ExbD
MRSKRRKIPEINSSSSADIAFLLLIFFLLTTSLDTTRGLYRRLPPPDPPNAVKEKMDIQKRNLLLLSIDENNIITCNKEPIDALELREYVKTFIANPDNDLNLPEKMDEDFPEIGIIPVTTNHVIAMQVDRNSSYQTYISVQNELTAAYGELRERFSQQYFGKSFKQLRTEQREIIRQIYPFKIAELEPLGEREDDL